MAINAGSASVKFAIFDVSHDETLVARFRGRIERIGATAHLTIVGERGVRLVDEPLATCGRHGDAMEEALKRLEKLYRTPSLCVVGHRVVHGGDRFTRPVLIDPAVFQELTRLVPLDPLHQPRSLALIDVVRTLYPNLAQVACLDTAFHADQPSVATVFALPASLREKGVRRYGFHGISYEYIARCLPNAIGAAAEGRVIVAHLGSGASMCAMVRRKSVATTMGFSSLDGLVMGTRCGTIDPGVLLYLLEQGWTAQQISKLLWKESGLFGVSGSSSDMRELLASRGAAAEEAVELFIYRIERELGSLAAAAGGLDALVFTAGIGENAPLVRARICERAAWLGVQLDAAANAENAPFISSPSSSVAVAVIPTDEELMIAEHSLRLARAPSSPAQGTPRTP
jgi:acetate kinase